MIVWLVLKILSKTQLVRLNAELVHLILLQLLVQSAVIVEVFIEFI